MNEDFEVLSALLDGEVIEIGQLERVLETPGGLQALVDFVRLRQAARADDARPQSDFHGRVQQQLSRHSITRLRVPLPLTAAAVVLAVLVGSQLDLKRIKPERPQVRPPEASRVLRFEPGVDWRP